MKYGLPTDLYGWRAAVFWPCKGSIIISSLIVIWYEWLDETLAVLVVSFIEFGFWVKILKCFYGTRRPYRVWHFSYLYYVFVFYFSMDKCFVGVMVGIFLTPLWFKYIFIYNFFYPFILIIRLNYLRDNIVIFLESSYWRGGLRPRYWIKVNFRCRNWIWLGLFDL